MYIVHYTVISLQYTLYTVQCTIYTVQYTVYNVQYPVYNIHCTMINVHSIICHEIVSKLSVTFTFNCFMSYITFINKYICINICIIQYISCIVQFTVNCKMYSIQRTLYTVHPCTVVPCNLERLYVDSVVMTIKALVVVNIHST